MTEQALPAARDDRKSKTRRATRYYFLIMAFTLISALVGAQGISSLPVAFAMLFMMVVKSQLIVDHFMGLKPVSPHWRLIMSAFSIFIALGTLIVFVIKL